ncbi:TPA_asm: hypothetical protein, partial [ssRNA phage SRR5466725_5]
MLLGAFELQKLQFEIAAIAGA